MPYRPLRPHPSTPQNFQDYLATFVDMQFADVHTMLRLPVPVLGLEAGCNFAAAHWAFALLNGAARMFVGGSFKTSGEPLDHLLATYFPWDGEPPSGGLDRQHTVRHLREVRDLLAHSLGVLLKRLTKSPGRQVFIGPLAPDVPFGVSIAKEPLTEAQVEELERSLPRPAWLGATLSLADDALVLSVPVLYRGARVSVERVTADAACIAHAQRVFSTFLTTDEGAPGGALADADGV